MSQPEFLPPITNISQSHILGFLLMSCHHHIIEVRRERCTLCGMKATLSQLFYYSFDSTLKPVSVSASLTAKYPSILLHIFCASANSPERMCNLSTFTDTKNQTTHYKKHREIHNWDLPFYFLKKKIKEGAGGTDHDYHVREGGVFLSPSCFPTKNPHLKLLASEGVI